MDLKVQISRIIVLMIILVLWQLIPTFNIISPYVLSPFSKVIASFHELFHPSIYIPLGSFLLNFLLTLREIVLGFALSLIIGLSLGLTIGYFRAIGDTYEPLVYVVHAIPGIILYPVLYLSLGFGYESKVAFAVILGVFPLIINTIAGVRQVKPSYVKIARSLGATEKQIFTRILLPAAGPNIMSGVRLSLGAVIVAVIAGEILASRAGLGTVIVNLGNGLRTAEMYAVICIVIVIACGMYFLMTFVERRAFPYEHR